MKFTEIASHSLTQCTILDIAVFFQSELRQLCDTYGYSDEEYRQYLDWHQPKVLVEKILDPDRFFRVVRDQSNQIIGFFESRGREIG